MTNYPEWVILLLRVIGWLCVVWGSLGVLAALSTAGLCAAGYWRCFV